MDIKKEYFINKVKKIHGNKYDYSKTIYINAKTKIIIMCGIHGEFSQLANTHLKGSGCPKCGILSNINKFKSTTEEFIKKAISVHGDTYNYSKVNYINKKIKIIIICKIDGDFLQRPADHLRGSGCPKCASPANKIVKEKNIILYDTNLFISKAKNKHGLLYDYSKTKYVNISTKLIIICTKHGEFLQGPEHHLKGSGCLLCSLESRSLNRKLTNDQYIKKAISVHGNTYNYSEINYLNGNTKIKIICNLHGDFLQRPYSHLEGSGCPNCKGKHYSKMSIEWLEFVANKEGIFIKHAENQGEFKIPSTKYKADGYCKENNTIYEFNGCKFHGCIKCFKPSSISSINKKLMGENYIKTKKKEKIIKELGYNLMVIWEHEWINFKKNLSNNYSLKSGEN